VARDGARRPSCRSIARRTMSTRIREPQFAVDGFAVQIILHAEAGDGRASERGSGPFPHLAQLGHGLARSATAQYQRGRASRHLASVFQHLASVFRCTVSQPTREAVIPAPKATSATRLEVSHFSIKNCDSGFGIRGGKLDASHRVAHSSSRCCPEDRRDRGTCGRVSD
jgi:hypothetical protein